MKAPSKKELNKERMAVARKRKEETETRNAKRMKENPEAAIKEQNALLNVGALRLITFKWFGRIVPTASATSTPFTTFSEHALELAERVLASAARQSYTGYSIRRSHNRRSHTINSDVVLNYVRGSPRDEIATGWIAGNAYDASSSSLLLSSLELSDTQVYAPYSVDTCPRTMTRRVRSTSDCAP